MYDLKGSLREQIILTFMGEGLLKIPYHIRDQITSCALIDDNIFMHLLIVHIRPGGSRNVEESRAYKAIRKKYCLRTEWGNDSEP